MKKANILTAKAPAPAVPPANISSKIDTHIDTAKKNTVVLRITNHHFKFTLYFVIYNSTLFIYFQPILSFLKKIV